MEDKGKFFEEKYNKILDLLEVSYNKLADKYVSTVLNLPKGVINKLESGKTFKAFAQDFQASLNFDGEMLEFDYTQYNKYYDVAIRIYPLYEEEFADELDDEELDEELEALMDMNQWFMFSLTKSNVKGIAKLKFEYELKDGKLECVNMDMNGVEIDYQVFLEKRDKQFFIMITKYLNGNEILKKEVPIDYDDLLEYSSTWDDINENEEEIKNGNDEF